jgi:hypothetical protein
MQRMITRFSSGTTSSDDEIGAGRRIQAHRSGPQPPLHAIPYDGAPNRFARDEAEAGDIAAVRDYAKDKQLVSVDTTFAVRGGKVFAPA